MATYAAVRSLMRLLEGIMEAAPDWVLHDKLQTEFLQEKVSVLSRFLEEYSVTTNEAVRDLEIKIRDLAYNTEDIIESYIGDQLLYEEDEEMRYRNFYRDLEIAIEEICCIQEEGMAMRGLILELNSVVQQRNRLSVDRSKLTFSGKNNIMVGFDDDLIKIKDWVTNSSSKLEVISIVGMGGIGKTTLARNVSDDPLIVSHFDIRSWVTVTQEYQVREILAGILGHSTSERSSESVEILAERLYKSLKDRRYLIVMDDLWATKAWDDVRSSFPKDDNGSRILLTTRSTDVGDYAISDHVLNLSFLSSSDSWSLLCKKVFGEESCPDELVGIGQDIARYCRGLPLSLVVVGGLLSMDKTVGYWETVASSINSILATDGGQCSTILSLSYNHLPVHLKPCFLYFAVFPEDDQIRRSDLIRLWVAEGFVKAENSDRLEDTAQKYLEDLVNRSLIMVFREGYGGKVKTYRIHDLLRDFCIIEARKTKFFHVTNRYTPTHPMKIKSERRVCFYQNISLKDYFCKSSGPTLLSRSLHCFFRSSDCLSIREPIGFRFLRILNIARIVLNEFPSEVVRLVHLRYISLCCFQVIVPASISSIWGLQTLIINKVGFNKVGFRNLLFYLPLEVWKMPHLRHLKIGRCYLPDLMCSEFESKNFVAMVNLQTLSVIINFRFSHEIIRRLPKLKKLEVFYDAEVKDWPLYHLSNIVRLNELETLEITSDSKIALPENCKFPSSLKKLTLYGCHLPWEHLTMVGSLPSLEVLILGRDACKGQVWEPNEGEFRELKFLQLQGLDLVQWRADDSHFPKLRGLDIFLCWSLEEIPIEIESIETLEWIKLWGCALSVVTSARLILDQRRSSGNDDLQVDIEGFSE